MGGDIAPPTRILYNVNPFWDAITGDYARGVNGEMILNGGLWFLTCVAGQGNVGKSTLMNDIALSVLSNYDSAVFSTFDTENSFRIGRMKHLAQKYTALADEDWYTGAGRYALQSKVEVACDKWNETFKQHCTARIKDKGKEMGTTPFLDEAITDKPTPLKWYYPEIRTIDSLSEFKMTAQIEKSLKTDADDKKMNNYAIEDGRIKTIILHEWSSLTSRAGQCLLYVAHVGETVNLDGTPQKKKLTFMKQGMKYKGVPGNTDFLPSHFWDVTDAPVMLNSDRDNVLYPSKKFADSLAKTDLRKVTFQGIRNKSGLSGVQFYVIMSQKDGVLWGLTQYDYLKEHKWGLTEVKAHRFQLALYPHVTLQRTTVRDLIDEDMKLRRALELSAEIMLGLVYCLTIPVSLRMPMTELYEKIKELGYDWDKIYQTRGHWMFEEEVTKETPVYLSGYDLLRIAHGEYEVPALKASA